MKRILFGFALLTVTLTASAWGQVSLTTIGVASTQNFDGLVNTGTSSTLPTGWFLAESSTNANATYTAGTGSGTTGDSYSFGASSATDRAFGGLQSGTLIPTIGAQFTNNTGSTLTSLDFAFTGEQWRLGTAGRVDRLDFQYSVDATSLTTGTWTDSDALDFTAPVTAGTVGALDGNSSANRTSISTTVAGLSIANGSSIWIRWTDFSASGADDGLAVDDFSITPHGGSLATEPTAQPTSLTFSNVTSTSFDVTFEAASGNPDGYIALRKTADDPSGIPADGLVYSVGNTIGDGVVVYVGNSNTFNQSSLTASTNYHYAVYSYNGSAATTNYLTTSPLLGSQSTNAPASSTSSDIVAVTSSESATISSVENTAGPLSSSTGAQVWQFNIRDGGGSADGDALPTILTAVTITQATGNGVSNWSNYIFAADLMDGTTQLASGTVSSTSIVFSGFTATAADNANKALSLRISLKTTGLTDNKHFGFAVSAANSTSAGDSISSQFSVFSTTFSDTTKNKVDVVATKLKFVTQPGGVAINTAMSTSPTVEAVDANNIRDLDYVTSTAVTATGSTLTGSPVASVPVSGLATFSGLTFSSAGEGVTLDATSGVLTPATSNSFSVFVPMSANDIMISHYSPRFTAATDELIVLFNNTNSTIDLSGYEIAYSSATGSAPSAKVSWTSPTTIPARKYRLLASTATVTIGSVTAKAADQVYTSFAADAGQVAFRQTGTGTVIYALAVGSITSYQFGQSTTHTTTTTSSSQGVFDLTESGTTYTRSGDNNADYTLIAAASVTSIPNSSDPALPVELTAFTATANRLTATLAWATATEIDNAGWEVERKLIQDSRFTMANRPESQIVNRESSSWTRIAFVSGSGTSNSPRVYAFNDNDLSAGRYAYRLKQIDHSGTATYSFAAEVEVGTAPKTFTLNEAYPNPFNPNTKIGFTIQATGFTTLNVYNVLGQQVATLFSGIAEEGKVYERSFEAGHLPSGLYLVRLEANGQASTKRLMLLK